MCSIHTCDVELFVIVIEKRDKTQRSPGPFQQNFWTGLVGMDDGYFSIGQSGSMFDAGIIDLDYL